MSLRDRYTPALGTPMYYTISHVTRFRYSEPISESFTEIRKRPLDEATQRCLSFELITSPRAAVQTYLDMWGNHVHHFNILRAHKRLEILTRTLVEVQPRPLPPAGAITYDLWPEIDQCQQLSEFWDYLSESQYVQFTPNLRDFAQELSLTGREKDPYGLLLQLSQLIYDQFEYDQKRTTVDSGVDEVLAHRAGVCQDFTHLLIALARLAGIPARYVSGYLFHRTEPTNKDRSASDATHAWVEAWFPGWGWLGIDPTNNVLVQERHIRVAIGRDYADVPPNRGVFTGQATSELMVAVKVLPAEISPLMEEPMVASGWAAEESETPSNDYQQQQ